MPRYWDDYSIGDVLKSSGRTITDADIRLFFGATDASHPAHVDSEYAKRHPFGRVVAPGTLTIGVVDGFAIEVLKAREVQVAHYGYDRIRFLAPVCPGETIHMEAEVVGKKEKKPPFGLLELEYRVLGHDGRLVAVIRDLQLVERENPETTQTAGAAI